MSYMIDDEIITKIAEVIGGEDAVKIIETLKDCEETTDDIISQKTEIRLNIVRKILYKLYDHSLVGLRRSRDPNTGWFIFHWRLQPDQIEGFILNQKLRVLEKLETRLEYEKNHDFYYCNTLGCDRIPFEEAVETVFHCPKCGKPLKHFDNTKVISFLSEKIQLIRKELSG